jgi:23S rRNA (guanosine2251-2'-O)-methyltransferase
MEALSAGLPLERVILRSGSKGEIIGSIISAAKSQNIRLDRLPPETFDRKFKHKSSAGVVAFISEIQTCDLQDLLAQAESKLESPFFVILDGIEDPHNLGAIARSVEAAGCQGLIISKHRSAPLSPSAIKASAGALLHLPVAKVTNLVESINFLRKEGVWVYGADMAGEDYLEVQFNPAIALVIGAEGRGLSRLVKNSCAKLVSIPLKGRIGSLNASVSAGILLFHIASKRRQ